MHFDQGWHYQKKQYRHALKEKTLCKVCLAKETVTTTRSWRIFFGIMKSEFLNMKVWNTL